MRLVAAFVVRFVISLIAIVIAAAVLDDFSVNVLTVPIVALIFTVIWLIARPALETVIDEHVQWAASFVGLIAAWVSLLVTDLITDDLQIEGIGTWVLAALVVWLGGILASFVLAKRITERIAGSRQR